MNDSIPGRLRPKTTRAQPLQPDRPLKGRNPEAPTGAAPGAGKGTPGDPASVERQKLQTENALDNVREGYG